MRPASHFQQFLSPSNCRHIALAHNARHLCLRNLLRSLVVSRPAAHNVSVERRVDGNLPTKVLTIVHRLSTYPQMPRPQPAVRRALLRFMPVNRAAQLRCATKALTMLQQNDSPISSDFRPRTPSGKAFRNRVQHSTKMLTVNLRPQNPSLCAGKLLTLAMDFSSLSVHKSPHLRHKTAHLHGTNPLFLRIFVFRCSLFVRFAF